MKKHNFKKEVALLRENKIYRFADVFLGIGSRWEMDRESILSDERFRNTILYDYLMHKTQEKDFETLKEIINTHAASKKYTTPDPDELVIHLRLGDCVAAPIYKGGVQHQPGGGSIDHDGNAYKQLYETLPLDAADFSKITFVTALHFGENNINDFSGERKAWLMERGDKKGELFVQSQFTEGKRKKSYEILEDLERQTNSIGFEMNLYSNTNIDADVCYLAHSKYLVQGWRRFSKVIARCTSDDCKVFAFPPQKGEMVPPKNLGWRAHIYS